MMWSFGMGWFAWVLMATWWVLVVAGIVWLVRTIVQKPESTTSARRVLDERFASGELSLDEYQERRRVLG